MVSSFPRLIAAAHVLHRLLAPRHSPCALVLLIRKNTFYCCYGVFKVRVSLCPREEPPRRDCRRQYNGHGGLSKLNSVTGYFRGKSQIEVDVIPGEPEHRTAEAINGSDAYRSKSSGIP